MKVVFAIVDKGANLVTFSRMGSAWLASNHLAIAAVPLRVASGISSSQRPHIRPD
jgi:uncharacterized protein GlcG (DUF336 family)